MSAPRALLMYSKPHFDPSKNWRSASSAGIIASGLYEALNEAGFDCVYIDPSEISKYADQSFDLFVGQNLYWIRAVRACRFRFKVLFMPVVNPVRRMIEMKEASLATGKSPEIFPRTDLDCFKECDAVFQIGNDLAIQELILEGVPPTKIYHLHYGLNPVKTLSGDSEKRSETFLYLSSGINLAKGFPFLKEHWEKARGPKSRLKIIGKTYSSEYEKDLKSFVDDSRNNAEYCGFIPSESPEYWRALNDCGSLLFPTIGEAEPGTVIEAMASGIVPLIDTKKSGINFNLFGDFSLSVLDIIKRYRECLNKEGKNFWLFASEKVRRHQTSFYSDRYWKQRLVVLFRSLLRNGALPSSSVHQFLSDERMKEISLSDLCLGERSDKRKVNFDVEPSAYLLVSPNLDKINQEFVSLAINRMNEYPAISSVGFYGNVPNIKNTAFVEETCFPEVSNRSFKWALIRKSHLKLLINEFEFIDDSLHMSWGKSPILEQLSLEAPLRYRYDFLSRNNPKRMLNRLIYRHCEFVKDF